MPNHFLAVALPLESERDFAAFLQVAAQAGRWLRCPNGYYIHWGPDQGVDFWGQADRQRQLLGGHPHFVGTGRIRMVVERTIETPGRPLDGLLIGTVNPRSDGSGGDYPLAVAIPDFDGCRAVFAQPGVLVTLQVAAFCEDAECFADDGDFHARGGEFAMLASEAMMPVGLFREPEQGPAAVEPRVLVAGHIEWAEQRINSFSGQPFWVMSLRTLGGWYDVVADPRQLKGEPVVGGVLRAICYLSGQLWPNDRRKAYRLPLVQRPGFVEPEVARWTPQGAVPVRCVPFAHSYAPMALLGLLLSLAGFGCLLVAPIGLAVSVAAWVGMRRSGNLFRRGFAIAGVVVGGLVTALIVALVVRLLILMA